MGQFNRGPSGVAKNFDFHVICRLHELEFCLCDTCPVVVLLVKLNVEKKNN